MYDRIMQFANVGEVSGTAVATFDLVNIVNPRGRFDVELYGTFLRLLGQTQEYRIQYDSIIRIFYLPKSSQQTLVVVSLDPPIRKGQTYYTHILCQLAADEDLSLDLEMSEEALKAKNDKVGVGGCWSAVVVQWRFVLVGACGDVCVGGQGAAVWL